MVQTDEDRTPADDEGELDEGELDEGELPDDGELVVWSMLGGYPALAGRDLSKTLDGVVEDAPGVAESADGDVAAEGAGDDGVLQTESAAGGSFTE